MAEDGIGMVKSFITVMIMIGITALIGRITINYEDRKIDDPVECTADILSVTRHTIHGLSRYDIKYTYIVDGVTYYNSERLNREMGADSNITVIYSEECPYKSRVVW